MLQECTLLSIYEGRNLKTFLEEKYLKLGKAVVGKTWLRGNIDP